jgi:hypothetical protein
VAFAVSVAVQNVWSNGAGLQPDADANAAEIVDVFARHAGAHGLLFAWVAVNVALLMAFLAGAGERLQGEAPVATRAGVLGGTLLLVFFPLVNVPLVALAIGGDGLADSPDLVEVLWQAHLAVFASASLVLGVTLTGFALAATKARLVPSWFRIVGPVGGVLLMAGSIPVKAFAEGNPALLFGLLGFLVWLVFLIAFGWRLWREDPAAA